MFHHALKGVPGEIEPVEGGIAALQRRHHPKRLGIVIEAAIVFQHRIQRPLARMTKRAVAEIMSKRHRLGEVLIKTEIARHRARDLRHLQRMGQPRSKVITFMIDEHLGLIFKTAKGGAVENAIAIPLKSRAQRAFILGEAAAARGLRPACAGAKTT